MIKVGIFVEHEILLYKHIFLQNKLLKFYNKVFIVLVFLFFFYKKVSFCDFIITNVKLYFCREQLYKSYKNFRLYDRNVILTTKWRCYKIHNFTTKHFDCRTWSCNLMSKGGDNVKADITKKVELFH